MNIPSSWTVIKFDELNEFKSATINPNNFSLEKFDLYSVPIFPLGKPENLIGQEIGSTKQLVEPDDILISKINPRINRVWKVAKKKSLRQIASSEWIVFRNKYLEPRYFLYYFRSPIFREKLCADVTGVGGSLTRAQPKRVAEFLLPVAPLAEQRRIADKLDTTLARVDALNDQLARITPLLKRFRQSVLAAAYTGKLTQEFRAIEKFKSVDEALSEISPIPRPNRYNSRTEAIIAGDYALSVNDAKMKIPEAWKWVPLVDVARMESGHTPSRSVEAYWGGGIPWIGIADARENHAGTILDTIQKTNEEGIKNSAARILPKGTICVSRTASVGYVVKMGKPMATSQDFVNWTCSEAINPDWLKWLFVAEGEALPRFGKGSTHTTIYFPEWLSLQVALPPVQEQNEIVRRVETLFAFADRLEARLQSAQTAAERLTPALLAKAFRGELVPQDPNDEPAAELLRRLRAARAADTASKPKRGRKTRTDN